MLAAGLLPARQLTLIMLHTSPAWNPLSDNTQLYLKQQPPHLAWVPTTGTQESQCRLSLSGLFLPNICPTDLPLWLTHAQVLHDMPTHEVTHLIPLDLILYANPMSSCNDVLYI